MFSTWDYAVFGLMLLASICIGIYHAIRGRGRSSTSEFLEAGNSMSLLPVALSLIATYESSVMMLGTPAEAYVYGFSWMLAQTGTFIGGALEIVLAVGFLRRLNIATPYEYFEKRFKSRTLRHFSNVVSIIGLIVYMALVLYGQGVAIAAVTDFSLLGSIIITSVVAMIYTTIGGLKAVIWADVLQFFIMSTGLLVVVGKTTIDAGGAGEVWSRASRSGRLDVSADFDPTVRHTVWNLFFPRMLVGFGLVFSPATVQRISAIKTLRQARMSLMIAIFGMLVMIGVALSVGIAAYGYYSARGCDPLSSGQIDTPNQIVPHLIMDLFRNLPGLPGLFLAALTSASLSTISSCMSAVSILTLYDFVKPFSPNMSDMRGLLVAKSAVVVSGIAGCMLSVAISKVGSQSLNQIAYTFQSITRSPLIATFYLGAIFSFVNTQGAITGFLSGMAFMAWLIIGSLITKTRVHTPYLPLGPNDNCPVTRSPTTILNTSSPTIDETTTIFQGPYDKNITETRSFTDTMYNLSYLLYSPMAILVVFVVGALVSLATGGYRKRADSKLVINLSDTKFWKDGVQTTNNNVRDVKLELRS